jgi:DNA invertase Pin-like site-specific DNA recombinase
MKAYSYVRFSTAEQQKGDSLRRQIDLSKKYAQKHGLVLDNTLNLQDFGKSAYSGKHRSTQGALGQFLKLIERGKIKKGSVLLIESLDRLSREEITKALEQFLAIIRKGIKIVTLLDNREYSEETINSNVGELIISLTIMARAHEESSTKAKRLKEAWDNKRKQVDVKKLTAKAPAWLKLSEDRKEFLPIDDRVKAIQLIYKMKAQGKGKTAIIKKLNHSDFWKPESNRRKKGSGWRESYVQKILQTPAVIGIFQPHQTIDGKRKPVGEPISDYFPAIIDKYVFYQVQKLIGKIPHKGGRTGNVSNLFTYIVKCGYCGSPLAFVDKGQVPKGGKYLVCDRARRGLDCCRTSIKYNEFEHLILNHCKGLRPQDLLGNNDETAVNLMKKELEGIIGELTSIDKEISNFEDSISLTEDKRVKELHNKQISKRLDKKDSLNKAVENLKQRIDTESLESVEVTLHSLKELLSFLSTATGKKLIDTRLKLRNEMQRLINKIDVYPEGRPRFTTDSAEKALKEMSELLPKGSEDYNIIKGHLSELVEHPKKFRSFIIHFSSGSIRHIKPEHKPQLTMDLDRDIKVLKIWITDPDGKIVCRQYDKKG